MYACVCRAVTERQIHLAILAGANSVKDLRHELGVIDECGHCASCVKKCLREAHHSPSPKLSSANILSSVAA
ncbi:MAG: (2Fe-2S)-binding protein [Methylophilaceae bacterium]|nr:(2Fe-2S)-binding protein [Methylophilaceae bacterium]